MKIMYSRPVLQLRWRRPNQRGAAVLIGIVSLAVLLVIVIGVAVYFAGHKDKPVIVYTPPPVSADDDLTRGTSNNEVAQDTRILAAGVKRDGDQRTAADNLLDDQALAIGDTTSDPATAVEQSRLSSLQTAFISESDRRLKAMGGAQQLLQRLTDDQRPASNKQLSDEVTAVTGLKAKAASETTVDGFTADKAALDKEYGNYLLAVAQVYLLVWANAQGSLEARLNVVGGKFQERLNNASDNGQNTAVAQTVLNSLQANKSTSSDLTTKAMATVIAIKPGDYNANRSVLRTFYNQMSTAHDQLANASQSANSLARAVAQYK